ncbi:MAG: helix-hairpin-helix domain-containing protein [Chloroflexia bacterium]|nr:helix-hairpin-helix domain-containing protein [Chloroflexia bacterium]
MNEQVELPDERRDTRPAPGAAYLSAVLIALALILLVAVARPRAVPVPRQAVIPTNAPTVQAQVSAVNADPPTPSPTPNPTQAPGPKPTAAPVTVYVTGEVRRPGLYTLPYGSRVGDAVRRAGGLTRRADRIALNLALRLQDEMQITVPRRPDPQPTPPPRATPKREQPPIVVPTRVPPTPPPTSPPGRTPSARAQGGPVNINSATQEELETLPGIGPTKARAIIEYRRAEGPFQTPEELQEVSGIGPKTWEGLKDRVRT